MSKEMIGTFAPDSSTEQDSVCGGAGDGEVSADGPIADQVIRRVQRTIVLPRPKADLKAVSLALCLQSKNLYNTTHFIVNNLLTSYEQVDKQIGGGGLHAPWTLKAQLHANQQHALDVARQVIASINAKRVARFDKFQAEGAKIDASQEAVDRARKARLLLLPDLGPKVENLYRVVLDATFLDNMARAWLDQHGHSVYARLPAKAAQQVVLRYGAAWAGFFAALKVFASAKAGAMTGRPRPPGYLPKRGAFVVELPLTQMGATLISLGSRRIIPMDFEESISLNGQQLDAWNTYRIDPEIAAALRRSGLPGHAQAQHLRIVPDGRGDGKGGVKFEVVVNVDRALPAASLLAKLESSMDDGLSSPKRNDALVAALQQTDMGLERLRAAGIDMGLGNTAAISYSTGHRAQVISALRLDRVLIEMDKRIDALAAKLTPPETRALQQKKAELKDQGLSLSREEERQMRAGLKALFADASYIALRAKRSRWLADYLHKLSCGIVRECVQRQVEVLVVGQNKGWKDGSDMGRQQNRRFGRIPHARLIELIRYKAEEQGLVVVGTEESYTSVTSFVGDAPLRDITAERIEQKKREREQSKQQAKQRAKDKYKASPAELPQNHQQPAQSGATAAAQDKSRGSSTQENPSPGGKRLKHERHTFVNQNRSGRFARVHADVNGAFNILRKVFKGFVFSDKLTLKYTVMRVSARQGLCSITNLGFCQPQPAGPSRRARVAA